MTEPRDVVRAFLEHLDAGETDRANALLAPDVEWRNTRLPTVRGAKVAEALDMLTARGVGVRVELHHVGADGSTVLTDRHDTLTCGKNGSAGARRASPRWPGCCDCCAALAEQRAQQVVPSSGTVPSMRKASIASSMQALPELYAVCPSPSRVSSTPGSSWSASACAHS